MVLKLLAAICAFPILFLFNCVAIGYHGSHAFGSIAMDTSKKKLCVWLSLSSSIHPSLIPTNPRLHLDTGSQVPCSYIKNEIQSNDLSIRCVGLASMQRTTADSRCRPTSHRWGGSVDGNTPPPAHPAVHSACLLRILWVHDMTGMPGGQIHIEMCAGMPGISALCQGDFQVSWPQSVVFPVLLIFISISLLTKAV